MRRAAKERLEELDRRLQDQRDLAEIDVKIVRAEAQAVNVRLNALEKAMQAICPHAKFTCTAVRTPEPGWLKAEFKCTVCGGRVEYEAGPGSDDDMPPRFRKMIGVDVSPPAPSGEDGV